MKVFLSSLISGFEPFRAAARLAVTTLRHESIMAEDFGAQPNSPQIACLAGVRNSDVMLLMLGEEYGLVQPESGLSATHEEYREARGRKPVIAFVQGGITPKPAQAAFIKEVQGWADGLFRGEFRTPADLQAGTIRALHDFELANAVGALDVDALAQKADALLVPFDRADSYGGPMLNLSLVCGPLQRILRPVEIEDSTLAESLHQAALFGATRVFDPAKGVSIAIEEAALVIVQERGARVQLDEQGSILLRLPIPQPETQRTAFAVLVQEIVQQQLARALTYAAWMLERVDPSQRLTHAAIAARIGGAEMLAWRTQRDLDASSTSLTLGTNYGQKRPAVHVSEPRPALRLNANRIVEDLLVPLRRQWKPR